MSKEIIYIFLGGGTGSALRYCIQLLMHERIVPYNFPWATFTVNIFGSFLIGLFYALSERFHLPFEVRLFSDNRIMRRIYHLLYFLQWRHRAVKRRILRYIHYLHPIKYSNRTDSCSGRRLFRKTIRSCLNFIQK